MELLARLIPALAMALIVLDIPVYGQISSPCSPSMVSSFTPCVNFVTNSSANGISPATRCCSSLRTLTNTSIQCMCLIVTGGVPLRIPINRTLAINLPRACNMPAVPLQCKTTGSPVAAPGPAALEPILSPSPSASAVPGPTSAQAPESDNTPLSTPPSPTIGSEAPTPTTGGRTDLSPSAAMFSSKLSPYALFLAFTFSVWKSY